MDQSIRELADRYWATVLEMHPLSATLLGVHDHDDRLEDLSEAGEQAWRDRLAGLRDQVRTVSPGPLDPTDRVTRALMLHELDRTITGIDLGLVELASDQMQGVHTELLMVAPQLTYPEPDHARAALARHDRVPVLLDAAVERFRAGLARGRTPAACVIARSLNSLDGYLSSDPAEDPFLAARLPEDWAGEADWRERALDQVRTVIRPAFERYRDVLRHELAPVARPDDRAGWCHLPDGDELYRALVRYHTTTDSPPVEIHELGRHHAEVVLPAEYLAITSADPGVSGRTLSDLPAVFSWLRSDPALRHRDAEEIVTMAEAAVTRATEAAGAWFGRLPSAPCRVEPIPAFLAADSPYAYYFPPAPDGTRAGTYFINTSSPDTSSRTEAESVAFHEAVPGHHLQVSIAQELDDLPEFRRHGGATAYVEGWALYAERLADEMELYGGPLDRLGMLTADSWRSSRLVVDTGLHALGWSRRQAVDYFEEHTPVPIDQAATEVDRYLAMPAQALSYKMGQLEITRLRTLAEHRLGSAFDLPAFHDVVLGSGAVTLPVLTDVVEDWIRDRGDGPSVPST
jgi:uncharacterized protein (DUF885 family)